MTAAQQTAPTSTHGRIGAEVELGTGKMAHFFGLWIPTVDPVTEGEKELGNDDKTEYAESRCEAKADDVL